MLSEAKDLCICSERRNSQVLRFVQNDSLIGDQIALSGTPGLLHHL